MVAAGCCRVAGCQQRAPQPESACWPARAAPTRSKCLGAVLDRWRPLQWPDRRSGRVAGLLQLHPGDGLIGGHGPGWPRLRCGQPDAGIGDVMGRCCWPCTSGVSASQDIAVGRRYPQPTCWPASELGGGDGGLFRWDTGGDVGDRRRRFVLAGARLAGGLCLARRRPDAGPCAVTLRRRRLWLRSSIR